MIQSASDGEIERRKKEECYTTRAVFEHLKALTPDAAPQAYLQGLIDQIAERDRFGS
jgi:hypothetical protein